ncbi:hypothetical protein DOTSEDRAFT_118922 [Dothistroma septosporum NZE10]|uniref:mRNA-capping enzyme subunit beta n=1 Tax=Dothistroma septosporum (strain NZE10 / CBS 128990) TaxID=675120 RepID=N1PYT1_DOTSN|nr:hypothetical protein DOTSEDRAFT_118922 [Dothistroma septosporum NZE10]
MTASEATDGRPPLKRGPDPESFVERPAKRGRSRKYPERPSWAQLHPSNPRSREPGVAPNSREGPAPASRHQQPPLSHANTREDSSQATQQSNGQPPPQMNGAGAKPWLRNPPLDDELILARQVLGLPWERSIKWVKPVSGVSRAVADWLFLNFRENADIGRDARVGAIEIEAKLGTLLNDRNERIRLPVRNACVLQPDFPVTFQSSMNANEHRHMNAFLNEATKDATSEPGRQKLHYKHTKETDSFLPLSKAGYDLLPDAAYRNAHRPRAREPSLRTSTNNADGSVVARIVKVKIADDLHVYGAGEPYDVRISMNLEVNFMGKDIDPCALHDDSNPNKNKPNRVKDRMSYRHLNNTFLIDLTRVDSPGMDPIYELELELNANVARDQYALLTEGRQSAYMPVVEGFVDNLALLMKQARGPA